MPDGSVSQRTRLGKFHSPLGPDAMALVRFDGEEGVNQLGAFRVDVLSPGGIVDLDSVLGLHGTVEIKTLQHGPRFYDGIITEAELVEERADGWLVQLVLRPWFWLAGLRRNQRIFHNKTAPQIIAEVMGDYAHTNDPRLMRSHAPIEYTVQYGESDLDFLGRMMERHGISYHFEHALADHVLVLTDAVECFHAAPGGSRIFHPVLRQHRVQEEHFSVFSATRRVKTGRIRLTDYNFKTPTAAMQADASGGAVHAEGAIESFDYPGIYLAQGEGRDVARMRAEQALISDGLFAAEGDTASLSPGMLITLTNHPDSGLNGKQYLLRDASHKYIAEAYASGAEGTADDSYHGQYRFHPQAKPFQPAIVTAPARIYGPQTALVVGEGEIDCDEYGRILVRFHWDLKAAHSMRCRVAQIWAGNGWGGMVIPRIGMEVLVEFLEGDPDKPLVTGCVYNGKNKVPYPLPEHKTRSTFKTDTHQGTGFNELRFEDARDEEEIFMHAQKDMNVHVLNNLEMRTDVNTAESVGMNKAVEIGNNLTERIGGNYSLVVGANKALDFVSAVHQKFTGFLGERAKKLGLPGFINIGKGNYNELIGMNKSEVVTLAKQEAIGLSHTVTVGRNAQEFVGHNKHTFVAGSAMHEAAKTSTMVAGETWQVACGSGAIVIHADGKIEIKGSAIDIVADKSVRVNGKDVQIN